MPTTKTELWARQGDSAVLNGLHCPECGMLLFPPQKFGCPRCGAQGATLTPAAIPTVGRLHSFAVVNLHHSYPTPYTIGEVELDAGPLIRALLDDSVPHRLNDRLEGRVVESNTGAQLVFSKVKEGQS